MALKERGYQIEEVQFDDKPLLRLCAPNGNQWLTSTNVSYPMTSGVVAQISTDKVAAYKYAQMMDVSTPFTSSIADKEVGSFDYGGILERFSRVVVKPSDGFGSNGVTLDITAVDEFQKAVSYAHTFSPIAVVQEQIEGDELRFTVLDGKVVSVLQRQAPRVVGDGVSTIAELIRKQNEQRRNWSFPFIKYPQLDGALIDGSCLADMTVLQIGEMRELSRATMVKCGAIVYEIIDEIDPSYCEIVERLASGLAATFIVADLFVQDYKQPAAVNNYWFNEFNVSPALKMYYAPVNKDASSVARMIVDRFDAMITKGL